MVNLNEESIEAHSCNRHTTDNNKTIMHTSYPGNSPFILSTDFNCKDNLNSVNIPKILTGVMVDITGANTAPKKFKIRLTL
jgi:hypothetical protein